MRNLIVCLFCFLLACASLETRPSSERSASTLRGMARIRYRHFLERGQTEIAFVAARRPERFRIDGFGEGVTPFQMLFSGKRFTVDPPPEEAFFQDILPLSPESIFRILMGDVCDEREIVVQGKERYEATCKDYRKINSVWIPFQIKVYFPRSKRTIEIRYDSVEVDVPVKPKIFSIP